MLESFHLYTMSQVLTSSYLWNNKNNDNLESLSFLARVVQVTENRRSFNNNPVIFTVGFSSSSRLPTISRQVNPNFFLGRSGGQGPLPTPPIAGHASDSSKDQRSAIIAH